MFKTAANAAPAVSVAPRSSERLSARREVPKVQRHVSVSSLRSFFDLCVFRTWVNVLAIFIDANQVTPWQWGVSYSDMLFEVARCHKVRRVPSAEMQPSKLRHRHTRNHYDLDLVFKCIGQYSYDVISVSAIQHRFERI